MAPRSKLDAKMPMPETAFCTKLLAATKMPSDRRPVTTSLSSTMSATIDEVRMPDMMRSAIVTVPNAKSSGISVGEPFGGKDAEQPERDRQGPDQDRRERRRDRGALLSDAP